jgi:hypothetical protein
MGASPHELTRDRGTVKQELQGGLPSKLLADGLLPFLLNYNIVTPTFRELADPTVLVR